MTLCQLARGKGGGGEWGDGERRKGIQRAPKKILGDLGISDIIHMQTAEADATCDLS